MINLLTLLIFLPLFASLALFFLPAAQARQWGFINSLLSLGVAFWIYQEFDPSLANYQLAQIHPWISSLGLHYAVAIDGISLPLIMLTACIAPLAWLGTWTKEEPKNVRFFVANILILQSGMYGTFLAVDLFLFYVFWEVVLIPMFFLIGLWGGQERIYATVKFFLYTVVGSLLMLVAIFWMIHESGLQLGQPSALFTDLIKINVPFSAESPWSFSSPQTWLFLAFTLAFVIKVPMVPFHTWLPDAHVQAPTIGSVFLAAVLLKMGTYGLLRLSLPFFPQAAQWAGPALQVLGVIGVLYGAFCALGQMDFKKLVAYSSVSHMGYILVGLFSFHPLALQGSLYQMINHGISAAGLFMIVGFLYERLHTRDLSHFGSLATKVPLMAIGFMIMTLSSVALPGTNGFVGEFPILLGTFQTSPWICLLMGLGVVFGAVYALRAYQLVMLGPESVELPKHLAGHPLHDLNTKEIVAMVGLAFFVFALGFFPDFFFSASKASLEQLVKIIPGFAPLH
jgi:NADH-quinone oxidoreductase subunit M